MGNLTCLLKELRNLLDDLDTNHKMWRRNKANRYFGDFGAVDYDELNEL